MSNAAVAVDPELTYVRAKAGPARAAGRAGRGARRARARQGRERRRRADPRPLPRRGPRRRALRAAVPVPARVGVRRARPHRPARRLRHRRRRHRPRPHGDRVRRGRLPPRRAVRPERRQPGAAGRHLRRAHRPVRRALGQGRRPATSSRTSAAAAGCCARRSTSTPTRTAGAAARRCCTTPSRPGTSRRRKHRDDLLAANESVDWHPEHIKHGRMGEWLRGNVDWALSRERYWGTPLPVWRCDGGHVHVIGSLAELEQLSGVRLEDPHRPFVDDVHFPCPECSATMTRVPEVIDVWFDSGSMPFAQWHAPHENEDVFRERFPADYICEALDQTRGWFYSLLAISTLLFGRAPYEHVVCLGLILDSEGQKMSKSQGQHRRRPGTSRPLRRRRLPLVLLRLQAAVGRLPLQHRRDRRERPPVPAPAVEHVQLPVDVRARARRRGDRPRPLGPLAAERDGRGGHREPRGVRRDERGPRDRGVRRRPLQLVRAPLAPPLLGWRPRRVRDAASTASSPSRSCSRRSRRSSPTRSTTTSTAASRACTSPTGPSRSERDLDLEAAMAVARETVRLGLSARAGAKAEAPPAAARGRRRGRRPRARGDRAPRRRRARRAQRQDAALRRAGRRARLLRGQAQLPHARPALRQGDAAGRRRDRGARPGARRAASLRAGRTVGVAIDGHDHELTADDLAARDAPLEGYQLEREGSHAVALELALDDDAAPRGPRPRGRPRRAERAQGGRPGGSRTASR